MQRILIIGCCGAGKSVLARRLGKRLRLPVHHLDRLWWQPGWQEKAREQFDAELADLLRQDRWIIDGNYQRTLAERLQYADTVILLQYSRRRCFWQTFKRRWQYRRRNREDLAAGCPERLNREFLRYIWTYNRAMLPRVLAVLRERNESTTLVVLKTPRETERFLASLPAF
ncbi:AAA family ATPase [Victivallis sp. Marseille-Q1083]|uniref:AAA family ATPase n=1 Tax=Victivallis sp. Marseille-Q1083 TaxID=2717288 RepID=UPI001589EED1|nr:AAA family ATPase [Victivallis sp. Marseille-Q1083]